MLLNIKKSYYAAAFVLASHLGAIAIALNLPLVIGPRLVLAAFVTASLRWQWRQLARWRDGNWRIDDDGRCAWLPDGDDSRPIHYELQQAETSTLWIRLLLEQFPNRRRQLFIWRDAVDPGTYRELHARIEQRRLPARDPS